MEKALTQQIETMCRMLTKTREDVKVLRNQVSSLHLVLAGDIPPPNEKETNPNDLDEEEILRDKNIEVGSREVMEILKVSNTTLKRWRRSGKLSFKYISINHVTYSLYSLYESINTGKIKCKGLDKITALERILTYSKNISQLRNED
jgi:hypothetical protein